MLGALRRCPTSLPRTLSSTALTSRVLRAAAFAQPRAAWRPSVSISEFAVAGLHQTTRWQQNTAAYAVEAEVEQQVNASRPPSDAQIDNAVANGPITNFHELESRGLVHKNVIRTITQDMGFDAMTEVQSRTINEALRGSDIIAQAKTGTGKTLGFLLPVLQTIISEDPSLAEFRRSKRTSPDDIRAIIISPTRELAEQIAAEARRLVARTSVVVQVGVGGTQKRQMLSKTQREGCHILIGTPGRLNDLLSDEYSGVDAPKLSCLVMDEADRLLDQGFSDEIREIQRSLPDISKRDRQTLMFSATVPREVVRLVRQTLKPGFHFVKTVSDDEEPTHERVSQRLVEVAGLENMLPTLFELCEKEVKNATQNNGAPFKAIVYFNSTAEVTLASEAFRNLRGSNGQHSLHPARVFEIHSKLSQTQRSMASDNFRHSKSGILFSSDVTARGMDFPNVSHVIQMGLPRERETYIHRIGRTARAGKEGQGWIIVSPLDSPDVRRRLHSLPLKRDRSLELPSVDMTKEGQVSEKAANILSDVTRAHQRIYPDIKQKSYMAFFGVFGWLHDKQFLVDSINNLAKFGWGMKEPPSIPPSSVHKLGLGRTRGLNTSSRDEYDQDSDLGSSRGRSTSSFDSFRSGSRNGGASHGGRSNGGFGRSRGGFEGRSSGRFGQDGRTGGSRARPWGGREQRFGMNADES
ncbi:DEAD-domain-containing protein [Glonium stellatum]|uniref:ATP-dependent RNA helicase n=1 Tax=Glonium stellatum TaxID=574774 RepID=A0A8E2ER04_9PEZI|nr:DEAD-domain-containing protein [Glonium stellatum]